MHFSGRIADSFDREFRCLYADSQIIDCFFNPEEEGMPYYPSYQAMAGIGMGVGPVMGLDLLSERYKAGVWLLVKHYFLLTFETRTYIRCKSPGTWSHSFSEPLDVVPLLVLFYQQSTNQVISKKKEKQQIFTLEKLETANVCLFWWIILVINWLSKLLLIDYKLWQKLLSYNLCDLMWVLSKVRSMLNI